MRVAAALAVLCGVLVVAGCGGAEDPTQRVAREAVQIRVAGDPDYDARRIHCTGNPRPWFVERQATESICAVPRAGGGCDWFRVELIRVGAGVTTRVRLDSRDAGCTLGV